MRIAIVFALVGLPAAAEVLDERAASKALFSTRGHDVVVSETLSSKDAKTIEALIPLMQRQLSEPVRYYGAIAWSPRDGIVHASLQASLNHHSIDAAEAAALAACAPLRSDGAVSCEVAARILPRRYEARELTLSSETTTAFRQIYRKASGDRALAISPTTGAWGIGVSRVEALDACTNGPQSAEDCIVVVQD